MSLIYRIAGDLVPVPFTVTPAPTGTPTAVLYDDLAMTIAHGGTAPVVAGSGNNWSYTLPATLGAGTIYVKVSADVGGGTATVEDTIVVTDGVISTSSSIVTVDEVKTALNKSSIVTVDDAEIQKMITAAEAEYTEYVAPLSGTVTETFNGGTDRLVLRAPLVTAVTAAAYSDGTAITVTDLVLDTFTGIVYWGYGTAGFFTWGTRNVTITYTVAALPANHREVIIADVAGYFEATQRGPLGPDDTGYSNAYTATPTVLFPRIRALAPPRVA